MLFHNSIRKYTLALLETFNGLKVQEGDILKNIPIKYSTREKTDLLADVTEEQILSGNYNFLPRSSLKMSTVVKNPDRQSNKFNKIATSSFGEFLFNAVAYDFTFELTIMCRGMNEASSIIEQIAARFNPNYTLQINEIPNQKVPTSIPVQLLDIGFENEMYEEISANFVTINIGLMLKGNFYSPVDKMEKIHNVQMFLNLWNASIKNEYNRAKLFDFEIIDNELQPPNEYSLMEDGVHSVIPVIKSIESADSIDAGKPLNLKCLFSDYDNKINELTFLWTSTGSTTVTNTLENAVLIGRSTEIINVSCMITDVHGNTSNLISKQITIL